MEVHGHAETPLLGEGRHVQHALGGHVVGHVVEHALLRHVTRNLELVGGQRTAYSR